MMLHLSIYTLYACTSIDGSGLNTNENSKGSHPSKSGGLLQWWCSAFISSSWAPDYKLLLEDDAWPNKAHEDNDASFGHYRDWFQCIAPCMIARKYPLFLENVNRRPTDGPTNRRTESLIDDDVRILYGQAGLLAKLLIKFCVKRCIFIKV